MSLPTHINTLAAWATLALVILGGSWYIEDSKREMDLILITIKASFEAESKRDAQWMLDDAEDASRIETLIREHTKQREDRFEELERGQLGILESLAKTREAIARHQGRHDTIGAVPLN